MKRICDVHSANHQIIGALTNDKRCSTEPSAFFLNHYKPEIIHDHDKLTVGRVTLPITGSLEDRQLQVGWKSFLKTSLFLGRVLMEHIDMKSGLESKPQVYCICFIEFVIQLETL